jgi:membrane protein YqaA with SNARE-associated domain
MDLGKSNSRIIITAVIGFFVGGLLGFLFRPTAFSIGQLPFDAVISRGSNLKGADQLLIPLAQSSFNTMFAVAIVGALAGAGIGYLLSKKKTADS